jgi:alpha-ketoglutarate-dependent taurine dioxygenase
VHLRAERPAIRLDARGEVVQVSINNYDRAPFRLPEPEMREFYRAYGALHRRLNDRSHWLLVRLDAGDALIFDNWRTLHGRKAYTGRRVFMGCYHNREDFDSRRRVLRA